ncbi:MAG: redoxin domain-containing protein [Salinivirgaceae bacterium]|nr:redoxin domain-containing protein [Salinivirgaceae bacterium]
MIFKFDFIQSVFFVKGIVSKGACLLFWLTVVPMSVAFAQDSTATVHGCDKSFANKAIAFVVELDPITEMLTTLHTVKVDSTGCFEVKLPLEETMPVLISFGKYSGVLYIEPGRNYDLFLPIYEDKTVVDSLNPYFEPIQFFFKTKSPIVPELTDAIANFDGIFNHFVSQKFSLINKYKYYTKVDTLAPFIDSLFADVNNPYFTCYKSYSMAYLLALTALENKQSIIKDYFLNRPILYQNPAYTVLFNQIFKDYIPYFADIHYGKRIVADIARAKSYTFAMETLSNNPVLRNDTLRELVLIKGIYDAIMGEQLPYSSCMQTLDSVKILTKIPKHKEIVENIVRKTRFLSEGTKAPDFELVNAVGDVVQLKDLQGKMVYLSFININSYTAPQELMTLNMLSKKYKEQLRVVTIAIGSGSMPKIKQFFLEQKYEWQLLDGTNDTGLAKKYNAHISPTCYLISPEQKLLQSPAPGPNDYFEYYLIKVLRANRIRELRKTN